MYQETYKLCAKQIFFFGFFPSHLINNTILFETDHVFPLSCFHQRWKHCLRHFYLRIILVSLTGKYHQHGIMEPQSISATLNRQKMYRKLDRILMILSGLWEKKIIYRLSLFVCTSSNQYIKVCSFFVTHSNNGVASCSKSFTT